ALAVIGALIGGVSLSGSLIAWAKLEGRMKIVRLPSQHWIDAGVAAVTVIIGLIIIASDPGVGVLITLFFLLSLALGVLVTNPIGGADMPVVISLYNALTGLAVAFEGFALGNEAMIIAGMVVGAAGTLLTQLMAKAMNRALANVLFGQFGAAATGGEAQAVEGALKPIEASDAAVMMAYAERV